MLTSKTLLQKTYELSDNLNSYTFQGNNKFIIFAKLKVYKTPNYLNQYSQMIEIVSQKIEFITKFIIQPVGQSIKQVIKQMSFVIKPVQAFLEKDFDTFTKMDPYIKIKIGNKVYRSKTHKKGGKRPKWSDVFQVPATGDNLLKVQMWDKDLIKDDFIGQGIYNLQQLYNFPGKTQDQYIDIVRYGKKSGRLLLSMQYNGPFKNQGFGGNFNQRGMNNDINGWGSNQNNENLNPYNGRGNNANTNQINWNNKSGTNWNNSPQNNWGNQNPNNGWNVPPNILGTNQNFGQNVNPNNQSNPQNNNGWGGFNGW